MTRPVEWSRDALDDLKEQVAHIAAEHPGAAERVAARVRGTGAALGEMATGRSGRASGTHEKSATRLPDIVAYAITRRSGGEVAILRVIHTSRDWPKERWPG